MPFSSVGSNSKMNSLPFSVKRNHTLSGKKSQDPFSDRALAVVKENPVLHMICVTIRGKDSHGKKPLSIEFLSDWTPRKDTDCSYEFSVSERVTAHQRGSALFC
jgi:hypothetical protein